MTVNINIKITLEDDAAPVVEVTTSRPPVVHPGASQIDGANEVAVAIDKPETVFCSNCGLASMPNAKFCMECTEPIYVRRPMTA